MSRDGRPITIVLIVWLLVIAGAAVVSASDPILYYSDGDRVVFTNTPSRGDAKPVFKTSREGIRYAGRARLPATKYDPYIERVARENGLEPALIKAVALVESGFNPRAVSRKGARGIMQFMPDTARRYGVTDLHDPYQSLRAGAEHLRDLLDEFDGNLTLALAAYNAGPAAVRRSGGVPDYRETQDYVRKIQSRLGRGARVSSRPSKPTVQDRIVLRTNPDGSVLLYN